MYHDLCAPTTYNYEPLVAHDTKNISKSAQFLKFQNDITLSIMSSVDFVSLDGFLGDISDDEIRHRKSSSHRVPSGRRKPEKVIISNCLIAVCVCA